MRYGGNAIARVQHSSAAVVYFLMLWQMMPQRASSATRRVLRQHDGAHFQPRSLLRGFAPCLRASSALPPGLTEGRGQTYLSEKYAAFEGRLRLLVSLR